MSAADSGVAARAAQGGAGQLAGPTTPAQRRGGVAGAESALAGPGAGGSSAVAEGGEMQAAAGPVVERSQAAADDSPDISEEDYAAFTAAVADFGLALGQKAAVSEQLTNKNAVYSPLSVAYALAMTYAGARGETRAEMKTVLRDSFSEGTFHSGANRLARELASRATTAMRLDGKEAKNELSLAGAMFLEKTLQVQPAFLDLLAREYASGVQRVDFVHQHEAARLTINDWVADRTRGKILDLLPMDAVDERTPFVLVNALYFYGSWSHPFRNEATTPADFHTLAGATVQVPTMHGYGIRTASASAADYSVLELGYIGNALSMIIVVPAQGKFESARSAVTGGWLKQVVGSLKPSYLNVTLPKFKLTTGTFHLDPGLKELGMKVAFTEAADLSGIAAGVMIASVLQKAFIAVDEDGTQAAAATAVITAPASAALDEPEPFVVDRPFLFFVRDLNGSILFSGQVVDPTLAD